MEKQLLTAEEILSLIVQTQAEYEAIKNVRTGRNEIFRLSAV